MKTILRRTNLLALALLMAVPAVWAADSAPDAAKIYAAKCASCHGKDGKGNASMAKAFKVEPEKLSLVSEASLAKPEADLIKITADGVAKMPAYKGKLTDAEMAGVVAYSRSLATPK